MSMRRMIFKGKDRHGQDGVHNYIIYVRSFGWIFSVVLLWLVHMYYLTGYITIGKLGMGDIVYIQLTDSRRWT